MDAALALEATEVADAAVVNGPEDNLVGCDAVRWHQVEQDVRRLRQRIFTASQAGDLKKVRNLQKLMLRSRSNALDAVRRVTEVNAGRKTAGVDGKVVVTADQKTKLVEWMLHRAAPWSPRPVERVYVPKSNGRQPHRPGKRDRRLHPLAQQASTTQTTLRRRLQDPPTRLPPQRCLMKQ